MSLLTKPPFRKMQVARSVGIASAVAIAVFGNVLAARHFTRWDATRDRRWSLAPATEATLRDLPEPVEVWVLLPPGDPAATSVKEVLTAYRAKAGEKLQVTYIDPDRDGIAYADLRRRFSMDDARSEGGLVVADAALVVATKTRHWFIGASELVAVERGADGVTARPREERAITAALRNVLSGEKATLCFSAGHGEPSIENDGPDGIGFLRDLLIKDNYAVVSLDLPAAPPASRAEKLAACTVFVVPGLRAPFQAEEANVLANWAAEGGRTLLAIPPIPSFEPSSKTGLMPAGLDAVLAPFGIAADETMVFEGDPERTLPDTGAVGFVAEPLLHPITKGLVGAKPGAFVPEILVHSTRSFRAIGGKLGFVATPLLQSSPASYGAFDLVGAATWSGPPGKKAADRSGPLVVAYAAEGPLQQPPSAPANAKRPDRAPRMVVLGTASGFAPETFRSDPKGRGFAFLLGGAVSWLAERPVLLDIPDKPPVAAGVRMREEEVATTFRTVVLYLPASVLVLFAAVFFFRRSGDRHLTAEPTEKPAKKSSSKKRASSKERR